MSNSNTYYSYENIDKTNANWRIIFGERSNGKTYGFKLKALQNFFLNGKQFAYVRRMAEETKQWRMQTLFNDMYDVINQMAKKKGRYNIYDRFDVIVKSGRFILVGYINEFTDDDGKYHKEQREPLDTIGFYFALSNAQYDKGTSYPNVTTICFDEFMTTGRELANEMQLLLNIVSTIKRKRDDVIIYLLGNTVNRSSQILEEMQINPRDINQGEIRSFVYYGENNIKNTVAVEYAEHTQQTEDSESYFTFGTQRERMIIKGEWETDSYPIIDKPITNVDFAFILEKTPVRLYCYLCGERLCIQETRVKKRLDYYTLTNGKTILKRKQYAYNSKYAERLVKLINYYWVNGFCEFDSNLTGEDFRHILEDM